jgi:hypothetical protein
MRDDEDEYTTAVTCRRPADYGNRMKIVDQATLVRLTEPRDYIAMYSEKWYDLELPWDNRNTHIEHVSELEKVYLSKRMLFARPCSECVIVNLRPFDLINSVMTRGQILNRVRHPIHSRQSGCYAEIVEVDEAEVLNRTYTITQPQPGYDLRVQTLSGSLPGSPPQLPFY